MNRREALRFAAAGGLALIGSPAAAWAGLRSPELIRRPIPSTGELLPIVGLGTARTLEAAATDAQLRASNREVIRRFIELGGTLIDTAPSYGRAEVVLGELVRELGVADRLFTATKVNARGKEAGSAQMEESVRRLAPMNIDLMQVHNLVDVETQLATVREWKAAGKVRYAGVTTSSDRQYAELEAILQRERLDFVQLDYSIDNRNVEERLLPLARERGVAVLVNLPFGRARLFASVANKALPAWAGEVGVTSWAQYFLKYLLGHPAITAVIPATSDPKHLADNMGAAVGPLPDERQRRRMVEYFES